jgi:hypothetical protein
MATEANITGKNICQEMAIFNLKIEGFSDFFIYLKTDY